ncbi:hypothetical protein [Pectobacterium phage PcaP1EGY]
MYSLDHNKPKAQQTATPEAYPQGHFKDKPCRCCSKLFSPKAPSELYCDDTCKSRGIQTAYLKRNYGITLDTYEVMLTEQNHKCKICGGDGFIMNPNRHKLKLVVDHCHTTGKVRGLLCHNCNRALGLLQDSEESLRAAIAYLNV